MSTTLKKEILLEYFPDECIMVGEQSLDILLNRPVELKRSEYGSNADLFHLLQTLAEAISFVENVISIYQMTKKKKEEPPSVNQIKEEIIKKITYKTIDGDTQTLIIQHVERKIKYK